MPARVSSRSRRTDIWPRAWRRHPLGAVVALIIVAIVAWQRSSAPPRPAPGTDFDRYHNRTFTCIYVADGDTIDVDEPDGDKDKTRIRLWGVDTPETSKSPQGEMYFGPEASDFTKAFVLDQQVRLVLDERDTRDRYNRLLAYVYVGDRILNEELIRTGYAYADTRFDHHWQSRFVQLEKTARKSLSGLWRKVQPEQMPGWRQKLEPAFPLEP